LRRRRPYRIDLLTFQFDRHGGFIIEIGQCPPEGFTTYWRKQIAPEKVTAWDLPPKQKARVRPRVGSGTDVWFRFDRVASADVLSQTAKSVLPFIEQAEGMFDDFDHVQKVG
jgi:hypothetical protein